MLDSTTHEHVAVVSDGVSGPYFMIPWEQLPAVETVLHDSGLHYWVDADAISLNGKPEVVVVNLGRSADATKVQRLLDAAA